MSETLSKRQQTAILLSTILASSMAFIDSTALNVALPALQKDLQIDGAELLWIVNGYALFLSSLLLVGGAMGDLFGRKKIFLIGIISFTIASVFCGVAAHPIILIIGRCLQGVGGALMVPGSLSIISALFPENRRGWAIGTWSMFSAMTTVFGPALGGWLAEMGWWRAVFFINVPLSLISIFYLTQIPESKNPNAPNVDIPGGILATLALAGLTYGFIEAPEKGFDSIPIIISMAVGVISLVGFIVVQATSPCPMMPLSLFKSNVFSSTNILTLLIYSALGGFLFFFPLNLIQVQGYTAELAGLTMLPFGVIIALLSRWSGAWSDRVGARPPLILGSFLCSIGYILFSLPSQTEGPVDFWTHFLPPILVIAVGMGVIVAPLTTAVMNSVPVERTGIASGVNNTIARAAGVLGIAILGAVVLVKFENNFMKGAQDITLSEKQWKAVEEEIPKLGNAKPPESLDQKDQSFIQNLVQSSFITSFNFIAYIASGLAFISGIMAIFLMRPKVAAAVSEES